MGTRMMHLIRAGLTFAGRALAGYASRGEYRAAAVAWLLFYIVVEAVIAYFRGNSGDSGLARLGLQGWQAAWAQAGSMAIGTFGSAWLMGWVLRLFRSRTEYGGLLCLYAGAITWSLLGDLAGLLLPGVVWVGVIAWLLYNLALLLGLMHYARVRWWQALVSIVITFFLVFGVLLAYRGAVRWLTA